MKYLALDIGNVCIKIYPENLIREFGYHSFSEIPPALLHLVYEEYERGTINEQQFIAGFRSITGSQQSDAELILRYNSMLGKPNPGMNELIGSLPEQGVQPVFFSDICFTHLAEVRRIFPAAAAVPDGIYSFTTGAKKPEAGMFEAFERHYGRPLLYTDDRSDLIDAARKRGWNAWQFTNAGALKKQIETAIKGA